MFCLGAQSHCGKAPCSPKKWTAGNQKSLEPTFPDGRSWRLLACRCWGFEICPVARWDHSGVLQQHLGIFPNMPPSPLVEKSNNAFLEFIGWDCTRVSPQLRKQAHPSEKLSVWRVIVGYELVEESSPSKFIKSHGSLQCKRWGWTYSF